MAKSKKVKKTIAEQTKRLRASYATLKGAMPVIGETAEAGEGLETLAQKVKSATVLTPDMELPVSAEGSIYPEDSVAIAKQPKACGTKLTIAEGNAKLLGMASLDDAVVACFAQDGKTYLKLAKPGKKGTDWSLGVSQVLVERELEKALVVSWGYADGVYNVSRSEIAVFYREEDMGMVQFWSMRYVDGERLDLMHEATDIWADAAPTNLCGAWTPMVWGNAYSLGGAVGGENGIISLVYLGDDGSIRVTGVKRRVRWDAESESPVVYAEIKETKTILPGERTGADVAQETANGREGGKHSDYTIAPPDTQEYASTAWCLTSGIGKGAMWLTYPGADGERYVLELWLMEDRGKDPKVEFWYEPGGCRKLVQKGYQACGAGLYGLVADSIGRGPHFFGVLSRLSGPNQRASVGYESWCGTFHCDLTPLVFGEEGTLYKENIGLLRVCRLGGETIAVGYAAGSDYRVLLVRRNEKNEMMGGPCIVIAQADTAAEMAECGDLAVVCCQKENGIAMQCVTEELTAVATKNSRFAVAQAVTGGRPGQAIKLKTLE